MRLAVRRSLAVGTAPESSIVSSVTLVVMLALASVLSFWNACWICACSCVLAGLMPGCEPGAPVSVVELCGSVVWFAGVLAFTPACAPVGVLWLLALLWLLVSAAAVPAASPAVPA